MQCGDGGAVCKGILGKVVVEVEEGKHSPLKIGKKGGLSKSSYSYIIFQKMTFFTGKNKREGEDRGTAAFR